METSASELRLIRDWLQGGQGDSDRLRHRRHNSYHRPGLEADLKRKQNTVKLSERSHTTLFHGKMSNRKTFQCMVLFALQFQAVVGTLLLAESPQIEISAEVPALSIESIYHPRNRFKYIQSPTPTSRWLLDREDNDLLLIKREEAWTQFDPVSGKEAPCAVAESLLEPLRKLTELPENRVKQIIQTWLGETDRTLSRGLARVDDSLVLMGANEPPRWISRAAKSWREVSLSPDGKRVAYIEANDLFVLELASGAVWRLTKDGSATTLNGCLDWVYQEEIYGRNNFRGYWWRPDSSAIAFLRLETSSVPPFTIATSAPPRGGALVERYPLAGDPLPQAQLWCAVLPISDAVEATLKSVWVEPTQVDALITRVGWREHEDQLWFQVSNRLQNDVSLYQHSFSAATSRQLLLREQTNHWLEVQELPEELPAGDFVRLSDLPSGRRRLWRWSADGASRLPLTPEDFDVRALLHVDKQGRFAIVSGDQTCGTVGQQAYQVSLRDPAPMDAITKELPWHVVQVSEQGRWFVDMASGLATPTTMWSRSLNEGIPARLLNREVLKLSSAPRGAELARIPASEGATLPAIILQPATKTPSPVLIEIYGGPLTPTVRDGWQGTRYLFHQFLAEQGIGVMVVDNRSSGGRGLSDAWTIHRRMGEVETNDVIAAADWLAGQPWVDAKRLGLRGWSFGGYLTLQAMATSDKFVAGVAGGSVTDWRNYDAIYTERYMGLPSDNADGYDRSSPTKLAASLSGRVLLLHGEVDDNVHLSNTLQMVAALQKAGKPVELMIYPGAAHAVTDGQQNCHLMQSVVDFLKRTLF